ncbi:MAG: hypothetical protein WBR24_09090 [Desulfobacterales bacterium]|jgi:hypothetical protein|nr:hypothetical protein [Deltaproteobacteria bacterium]
MLVGEKLLDHSERSAYRFKELREKMDLPRVREKVRSKRYGTVWKMIEEKENWLPEPDGIQVSSSGRGPGAGR